MHDVLLDPAQEQDPDGTYHLRAVMGPDEYHLEQDTRTMTAVLEQGPSLVVALGDQEHSLDPGVQWTVRW